VDGVNETTSSKVPNSSSSLAANSKSFQPGVPSQAISISFASSLFSAALPNRIRRVAP